MSSNEKETAVCGSILEDLDGWEVITCHQNWTSVPQLIETSAYFQLVRCKSSDIICQPYVLLCNNSSLQIPNFWGKLSVNTTILPSKIVADGGLGVY